MENDDVCNATDNMVEDYSPITTTLEEYRDYYSADYYLHSPIWESI